MRADRLARSGAVSATVHRSSFERRGPRYAVNALLAVAALAVAAVLWLVLGP